MLRLNQLYSKYIKIKDMLKIKSKVFRLDKNLGLYRFYLKFYFYINL